MNKTKIYLSLPITGFDLDEVKVRAEKLKQEILTERPDAEVITPFDVCDEPGLSYGEYLGRDIAALLGCDAIHLCEGWLGSKGCKLEYKAARLYGLKIYS